MRPSTRIQAQQLARNAPRACVALLVLLALGCSQHSAFIRYDEYADPTLQPEPIAAANLGRVRITEGGALWKECTDVARGSLWLLVEEAKRRGGNAVGDIRWMPQATGGTLQQPTCTRRWGLFLVWPLLLTPAFMAANVEGTVYWIEDDSEEVSGLYGLPSDSGDLEHLVEVLTSDLLTPDGSPSLSTSLEHQP